jgi:hypothetical protein
MRIFFILTAFCFICSASCFAKEVKGKNYTFQVENNVEFKSKFKSTPALIFYSFVWGNLPARSLLMLSHNPAFTSKKVMELMSEKFTLESFKKELQKNKGMLLKSSKKREVSYGLFSGYEFEFIIGSDKSPMDIRQYIFILFDGSKCWNGQLTCTTQDDIKKARNILKSAKKIKEESK